MDLKSLFPRGSNAFFQANGEYTCATCGKSFTDREHKTRKFCSLKCAYQKRNKGPHQWTLEEDKMLIEFYNRPPPRHRKDIKTFSKKIGRSGNGIHCRAHELGLDLPIHPKHKKPSIAKYKTQKDRSAALSNFWKNWHKENVHPLLGKEVSQEVRDKISRANSGRPMPPEQILKMLRTKKSNGTLHANYARGSWKAGWREIGGKRIYARSRWEANYARYLEFQKVWGMVQEWEHEPDTFWFEKIKRGVRSYTPDFKVTMPNNSIEYHEVKGWMDPASKTKIKRMGIYHPSVKLVIKDSSWFRANHKKLKLCVPNWESATKNCLP